MARSALNRERQGGTRDAERIAETVEMFCLWALVQSAAELGALEAEGSLTAEDKTQHLYVHGFLTALGCILKLARKILKACAKRARPENAAPAFPAPLALATGYAPALRPSAHARAAWYVERYKFA